VKSFGPQAFIEPAILDQAPVHGMGQYPALKKTSPRNRSALTQSSLPNSHKVEATRHDEDGALRQIWGARLSFAKVATSMEQGV
jgi:hypothetical protein